MKTPAKKATVKTEAKTKLRMRLYRGRYSDNAELHETTYDDELGRVPLGICDRWTRTITQGMALKQGAVVDVCITVRKVKPPAKKKA